MGDPVNTVKESSNSSIKTRLTSAETSLATKIDKVDVPSDASSTGTVGQIAIHNDHIYVCVATNTWKRAAISTWSSGF